MGNHLTSSIQGAIINPKEYNNDILHVNQLYEERIDSLLCDLKMKIMNRFKVLKLRRITKLQTEMKQNHKLCVNAQQNIQNMKSMNESYSSFHTAICIETEIKNIQNSLQRTKQKDTKRIMSLIGDSEHILQSFEDLNIGQFVDEYLRNKHHHQSKSNDQLLHKMDDIFFDLVTNRDAPKNVIGMTVRRQFKQCELRSICDGKISELVRLMMRRNPTLYRWQRTKMNEYVNGDDIVGLSNNCHNKRLCEFISNLLVKQNDISLDTVYECVKRIFVRNYDSWKYCVFSNVSHIFYSQTRQKQKLKKRNVDEMDALYFELQKFAKMNQFSVDLFMSWLHHNEYDQDSIIDDIKMLNKSSNILRYFMSEYHDGYKYFDAIKKWS